MVAGMTYYQICWYFLIYSFGGWIVEVIFHAITLGKVVNRGFLNGPVCPVYGFGVLSVFTAINLMQSNGQRLNSLEIFLFGVILATLVELLAGWLLDRCFHARWWDYSTKPFNFRGYICLEFSLIWGLAILFVVHIFQTFVDHHTVESLAPREGWILLALLYAFYLADFVVTLAIIRGFNKTLTKLDQIQSDMRIVSDRISERVGTRTLETAQIVDEGKLQSKLAKAELKDLIREKKADLEVVQSIKQKETLIDLKDKFDALQGEFDRISSSLTSASYFGQGRLLKAFPGMKHQKYPELVKALKEKLH
ncbi:putative ABC transporter permease [Kallipyga massiliensis]|uniref:putative ABC transporter permease n=1 Tax=Kallipyga massiliensis TaxID=1472764 RepID=UPI0026F37082|nr:putative ABC transporter permease [Kallipyga massiliensis]